MIKLFFVLLYSSCLSAFEIDYELQVYVNDFIWNLESKTKNQEIKNRIKTVKVRFGKIEDVYKEKSISGFCYFSINTVIFDKTNFLLLPESVKQEAVDHELGHCLLGLVHNDNIVLSSSMEIPESIMFPSWFGYNEYLRKEYFRNKMFSNSKEFFKLKKQYDYLQKYRMNNNGQLP